MQRNRGNEKESRGTEIEGNGADDKNGRGGEPGVTTNSQVSS